MTNRLLLVDDDVEFCGLLSEYLRGEGFDVEIAYDGLSAIEKLRSVPADITILDVMMPTMNGLDVLRELRRFSQAPVLMLTARGEDIDRIVGLELGADDYVAKPCNPREIVARVRAILRRVQTDEPQSEMISVGRLRVDREGHQAWVGGDEVMLTALEFKLLYALISGRGRVQTRDQLLDVVWGIRAEVTTRTVDTHVKRLRQKLGEAGGYIETRRGIGYRFNPELPGEE